MATSVINGLTIHVERTYENHDQLLIEVDDRDASFHALCKLYVQGMTAKAEALSSDALGDANRMDAWLSSLSSSEIRTIMNAPDEQELAPDGSHVESAEACSP